MGATSAYVDEASFEIESLVFEDTLVISGNYPQQTVCLTRESPLIFGTKGSIDVTGWPCECLDLSGTIIGLVDSTQINTLGMTLIPGCFEAKPCTSSFYGRPFYMSEYVNFNWKAVVGDNPCTRPPRIAKPTSTQLHIYHNFLADSIRITDHHPDSIYVGDSVRVAASTTPRLAQQPRALYWWRATNPPGATSRFKYDCRPDTLNYFFPNTPGNYEIYFMCCDTLSGYCDTSAHKTVVVRPPELKIDSPRKDTTFWISVDPQMPEIKCRAHIANLDSAAQETLQFNWRISIDYGEINLDKTGSVTGIRNWIPDFETDFAGGAVTIDVGVEYGADSLTAHYVVADHVKLLGRNIQGNRQTVVEAHINGLNQYEDEARSAAKGAACYETDNYFQFHESGDSIGLPYHEIGGGAGRGIMQLTFGAYVTRNSLWSWHENVRMGTQVCHENYNSAIHNFTDYVPGYQPTAAQITRQILSKYNGGTGTRYSKYYPLPINDFLRDTIYCADCGACGRTGEHFKTEDNNSSCDQDCDNHTPYCYGDGAYNCAH
jgi:hypothetical protein